METRARPAGGSRTATARPRRWHFESEITIAGRTESIPAAAEDILLAAAAEVFSALRDVHAGAALALTVMVGEHEAELVVRDGALQGRDPGDSALAEALVRAASRVPGAGLVSTGSGALLRCRVPFAGRASKG